MLCDCGELILLATLNTVQDIITLMHLLCVIPLQRQLWRVKDVRRRRYLIFQNQNGQQKVQIVYFTAHTVYVCWDDLCMCMCVYIRTSHGG